MIKRTIEISSQPFHLAVRDEQLLLHGKEQGGSRIDRKNGRDIAAQIPCEDIGVLMVDHRQTTYTHHALIRLAESGASVVICGEDHHPTAMCLPLSKNTRLLARLDAQLYASKPLVKNLWKQIVMAKIIAQAEALPPINDQAVNNAKRKLRSLAGRVRSGDPENIEAQAAVIYWPVIFRQCHDVKHPFRRLPGDRVARPPNNLLDYGYSALRASVARSLVSAGLLPAVGIKHKGRSNPFCLADDLMEPLRPLVDRRVRWLAERGELELSQDVKAELLGVLTEEVGASSESGPLMVAMNRYVASFVRVLLKESKILEIPSTTHQIVDKS